MEFFTRLGQFVFLEPAERTAILDARSAALTTYLARLTALTDGVSEDYWSSVVVTCLRDQTEAELRWLGRCSLSAPTTLPRSLAAERDALGRGDIDTAAEVNVVHWIDGPHRGPDVVPTAVREAVRGMQRRAFETMF